MTTTEVSVKCTHRRDPNTHPLECNPVPAIYWVALWLTFFHVHLSWWIFDLPILFIPREDGGGYKVFKKSLVWTCMRLHGPGTVGVFSLMRSCDARAHARVYDLGIKLKRRTFDDGGVDYEPDGVTPIPRPAPPRSEQPDRVVEPVEPEDGVQLDGRYSHPFGIPGRPWKWWTSLIQDILGVDITALTLYVDIALPERVPERWGLSIWLLPSLPVSLIGLCFLAAEQLFPRKLPRAEKWWLGGLTAAVLAGVGVAVAVMLERPRRHLKHPGLISYVIMSLPIGLFWVMSFAPVFAGWFF